MESSLLRRLRRAAAKEEEEVEDTTDMFYESTEEYEDYESVTKSSENPIKKITEKVAEKMHSSYYQTK